MNELLTWLNAKIEPLLPWLFVALYTYVAWREFGLPIVLVQVGVAIIVLGLVLAYIEWRVRRP